MSYSPKIKKVNRLTPVSRDEDQIARKLKYGDCARMTTVDSEGARIHGAHAGGQMSKCSGHTELWEKTCNCCSDCREICKLEAFQRIKKIAEDMGLHEEIKIKLDQAMAPGRIKIVYETKVIMPTIVGTIVID